MLQARSRSATAMLTCAVLWLMPTSSLSWVPARPSLNPSPLIAPLVNGASEKDERPARPPPPPHRRFPSSVMLDTGREDLSAGTLTIEGAGQTSFNTMEGDTSFFVAQLQEELGNASVSIMSRITTAQAQIDTQMLTLMREANEFKARLGRAEMRYAALLDRLVRKQRHGQHRLWTSILFMSLGSAVTATILFFTRKLANTLLSRSPLPS